MYARFDREEITSRICLLPEPDGPFQAGRVPAHLLWLCVFKCEIVTNVPQRVPGASGVNVLVRGNWLHMAKPKCFCLVEVGAESIKPQRPTPLRRWEMVQQGNECGHAVVLAGTFAWKTPDDI